ncbi:hypothetical protein OH491_20000 [Termitidicoccus mucosus]|uniref:hypothetical protein n=1 Tax=Termitidicoccus mucosus TaxID=1184151 RepID=UPI0011AB4C47
MIFPSFVPLCDKYNFSGIEKRGTRFMEPPRSDVTFSGNGLAGARPSIEKIFSWENDIMGIFKRGCGGLREASLP